MASVNKAIIVGNLGQDPTVRYTPDGAAVCNISVATTSQWKDKASGEKREETEWHRIVFYNRLAEIAGEYLRKGSSVYVEGRIKTRKWQDKETGQDRYTTEIVGDAMQMLGSRGGGGDDGEERQPRRQSSQARQQPPQDDTPAQRPAAAPRKPAANLADMDDDIPFG